MPRKTHIMMVAAQHSAATFSDAHAQGITFKKRMLVWAWRADIEPPCPNCSFREDLKRNVSALCRVDGQ